MRVFIRQLLTLYSLKRVLSGEDMGIYIAQDSNVAIVHWSSPLEECTPDNHGDRHTDPPQSNTWVCKCTPRWRKREGHIAFGKAGHPRCRQGTGDGCVGRRVLRASKRWRIILSGTQSTHLAIRGTSWGSLRSYKLHDKFTCTNLRWLILLAFQL